MANDDRRVASIDRGDAFEVLVNGDPVTAYAGETVAGVLIAENIITFRKTLESGEPRSQFCGMGICYDCLVSVDNGSDRRACMTAVMPGMSIQIPGSDGCNNR